ncbi:MAG: hypothetical protein CMD15_07425 [Flavobacteriales bacterium]|nr:hypothetical protein [Flavobacteriales bacterium]|tara:strand:- start:2457 stop:3320 length:864 start_codon:yes stop_codon:yes gene_type:complete
MRKIYLILLCCNFVYAQNISIEKDTILIGEQIEVSISCNLNKLTYWPDIEGIISQEIEIIKLSQIDTSNLNVTQKALITVWDSNKYIIPAFTFSENNVSDLITLYVQDIDIKDTDTILKDIKGPLDDTFKKTIKNTKNQIIKWIIFAIIFIIMTYILYMVFLKRRLVRKSEIHIPAEVIAFNRLSKLEQKKLWETGKINEYHTELSEIIRRYLEARFKFIALELTTDEILTELKSVINNDVFKKLQKILERADLAKFAKNQPTDLQNLESMSLAKEIISSTKKSENE